MDIQRIRSEVAQATTKFAYVEAHPTTDGGVFVKAAMQLSSRRAKPKLPAGKAAT